MSLGSKYGGPVSAPQAAKPAAPPPTDSALRNVEAGISEAVSRVANLIQRVNNQGEYLFGPCPEAADGNGCAPVSPGIVHSIQESIGTLHSLLTVLNDRLDRISLL